MSTGFAAEANSLFIDPAVAATLAAVVQCCAAARHELNPLESSAWIQAVEKFTPAVVNEFIVHWMMNRPGNRFPSVADLREMVDPTFISEEIGLDHLMTLVKRVGPYDSLKDGQASPQLIRTIECMGGWAQVCEAMPDPAQKPFEWKAFGERFSAAYRNAAVQDFQTGRLPLESRPALPLAKGLHEMNKEAAWLAAQLAARRAQLAGTAQRLAIGGENVVQHECKAPGC